MKVGREERGWAGHLILSHRCLFRRNTLLSHNNVKIVVSTVGLLQSMDGRGFEEVGVGRFFETMAFHAENHGFFDANVSREVPFYSPFSISEVDAEVEANNQHEKVCEEISARLLNDEFNDKE